MVHSTSLQPEQQLVLEILLGIGPDVITAELIRTFETMMLVAIVKFEIEHAISEDKELRTALNLPSLQLLVALWKVQPSFWDPSHHGDPSEIIRPIDLAKLTERTVLEKSRGGRTLRVIEDTLAIFDADLSASDLLTSLTQDRSLHRTRETIKRSIMFAAAPLARLGLLRTQEGRRGRKQTVTSGLSLTEQGAQFIRTLFRHAVSASADHHPTFSNEITNARQAASIDRSSDDLVE